MSTPLEMTSESNYFNGAPSFSLGNRIYRAVWILSWAMLARWTPPPLHRWRRLVLRAFGARIGAGARIAGKANIWFPPHLEVGAQSVIGAHVNCYTQGRITIGTRTTISQGAHLCAGTHDFRDPNFPLVVRPISIGNDAWIAAEAFVGPGTIIGDGCVLGARGVLFGEGKSWTVYSGNPAQERGQRIMRRKS